jgi:hypothetical protein
MKNSGCAPVHSDLKTVNYVKMVTKHIFCSNNFLQRPTLNGTERNTFQTTQGDVWTEASLIQRVETSD